MKDAKHQENKLGLSVIFPVIYWVLLCKLKRKKMENAPSHNNISDMIETAGSVNLRQLTVIFLFCKCFQPSRDFFK